MPLSPFVHFGSNSTGRRKYRIIIDVLYAIRILGSTGIRLQVEARSMDQAEILATEVAA